MPINTKQLTKADVGRFVRLPSGTLGRLSGWKGDYCIVVINCANDWARYREFSGESIPGYDLTFCDQDTKQTTVGWTRQPSRL